LVAEKLKQNDFSSSKTLLFSLSLMGLAIYVHGLTKMPPLNFRKTCRFEGVALVVYISIFFLLFKKKTLKHKGDGNELRSW
jgi:hypothetical protein